MYTGLLVVLVYSLFVRSSSLRKTTAGTWSFVAAGAIAVFSHYFLDTLYNHGKGLAAFGPFSDDRVALPIPWLAHMQLDPLWSAYNLKVWTLELLTFGAVCSLYLMVISPLTQRS